MKIRKLKIKNYKIFDDVEFDFTDAEGKTLDTIVLAGVNGCGKTTVLEVLKSLFMRDFSVYNNIEIEFELSVGERIISTSQIPAIADNDPILKKISRNNLTFNIEDGDLASLRHFMELRSRITNNENLIYLPISNNYEDQIFHKRITTLDLTSQKDELKELVLKNLRDEVFKNKNLPPQKLIEDQIKNVTRAVELFDFNTHLVDFESEELVFESANGQRIYFKQLSHGEQNLYFRAIYLSQLNLKDAIIMIDEPEAAFHPTWQQKIAQLYQNVGENNQVFMATHSPHIMASVPPECLFMLHIDESEGKRKIQVINAAKAGKHSQGLEPDRILKEIMQVKTLRDYETQRDIDELTRLLTLEAFESKRAEKLADKLTDQLGRQDPFIIRLEHQMLMLRRKKPDLAVA